MNPQAKAMLSICSEFHGPRSALFCAVLRRSRDVTPAMVRVFHSILECQVWFPPQWRFV